MAFRKISDLSSSLSPSGDGIIPLSEGGKTYGVTLDTIKNQIEGVLTSGFTDNSSYETLSTSVDENSTSIDSLNQFTSSADGRLSSLETFTGSLDDTFATDLELRGVQNIFNSYTSSNNNINSSQDSRLDSLETFTGSLSDTVNDIITIEGRLDELEIESGSIRSEFNSFTSSFLLISESFDQRISAIEDCCDEPNPTPTPTSTVEPTATPVPNPTSTVEPDPTPTVEPTATPVPDPTSTVEPTPTVEIDPTPTPTVDIDPTPTPTVEPTPTPAPVDFTIRFQLDGGNSTYSLKDLSIPQSFGNTHNHTITGYDHDGFETVNTNVVANNGYTFNGNDGELTYEINGSPISNNQGNSNQNTYGFFTTYNSVTDSWDLLIQIGSVGSDLITEGEIIILTISGNAIADPTPTATEEPIPTATPEPDPTPTVEPDPTPTPTTDYTLFTYMIVWRRNTVANGMLYDFTRLDENVQMSDHDDTYFYSNEQIKCIYETFGTGGGNFWYLAVGDNSEGLISVGDNSWNRVNISDPTNIVEPYVGSTRAVWNDTTDRMGNGPQHYIITFVSGEVTDLVSFDSIGDVSGCVPYIDPTPTPTATVAPTPTPTEVVSYTTIPDSVFEQKLIDLGYDTAPIDGQVPTANISGLTSLTINNENISDLTGIEDFTSLTYLQCTYLQLTSLDVSNNTALIYLHCFNNNIPSLDVTNNTALIHLNCRNNDLTSLDIRNGSNTNFTNFYSMGNPDLTCIFVDDAAYSTTNWTSVDANSTFVNNESECSNLPTPTATVEPTPTPTPTPTEVPTYTLTNNGPVNEGQDLIFTLTTTNVPNGTEVTFTTGGDSTANVDYTDNLPHKFVINNNTSTWTVTTLIDNSFDGSTPEALIVFLNATDSLGNDTGGLSSPGRINDIDPEPTPEPTSTPTPTSTPEPTPTPTASGFSINGPNSIDEGDTQSYTFMADSMATGTTVYWELRNFGDTDTYVAFGSDLVTARTGNGVTTDNGSGGSQLDIVIEVATDSSDETAYGEQFKLVVWDDASNYATPITYSGAISGELAQKVIAINEIAPTPTVEPDPTPTPTVEIDPTATPVPDPTPTPTEVPYTTIPDSVFEQTLIDLGHDTAPIDGKVPTDNISSITSLNVINKNIANLTGIEDFIALTYLNCGSNQLTSLDVSNNSALIELNCYNNQLTSLDVSTNTALTTLWCDDNQLTSLDVRNGNNTNFTNFYSTNNPDLTCIFVDDTNWSTTNWTSVDANSTFVNNESECSDLTTPTPTPTVEPTPTPTVEPTATPVPDPTPTPTEVPYTTIPDSVFEQKLINLGYDTAPIDGQVPTDNISGITDLNVDYGTPNGNITDLTGIEDFISLTDLSCRNNDITSLDLSNNTALTYLNCKDNTVLASLNVSNNILLESLFCQDNQLTSLDVSNNTNLYSFYCGESTLTSLNLRNGNNTQLTNFNAVDSPNLTCIYVDDTNWSTTNWTNIDANSTFVENESECSNLTTPTPTPTVEPTPTPTVEPTATPVSCISTAPLNINVESEYDSNTNTTTFKYITSDLDGNGGLFGCINVDRGSTVTINVTGSAPNLETHPIKITNFNGLDQHEASLPNVVSTWNAGSPYTLTWEVPCDMGITQYQYQCENHSNMRGVINVSGTCPTPTPTPNPTATPNPTPEPEPTLCLTSVNTIQTNGGKYKFNGSAYGLYGVNVGTYIIENVPGAHPIAFLNNGKESLITYSGEIANGSKNGLDGNNYTFYSGDVTVNVIGDFDTLSYECYYHGYMGGENNLVFDETLCNPNPTPTPTSTVEPTSTPPPTATAAANTIYVHTP